MGHAQLDAVNCGKCGQSITESPNAAPEDRKPCPTCGSTSRRFDVSITASVEAHADLGLKHKRPGVKKPLVEAKHGDSLSTKFGRWMRRSQVVDRENNRYRKLVVDPQTGETLRDVDEPLSEHQGYGDAKKGRT